MKGDNRKSPTKTYRKEKQLTTTNNQYNCSRSVNKRNTIEVNTLTKENSNLRDSCQQREEAHRTNSRLNRTPHFGRLKKRKRSASADGLMEKSKDRKRNKLEKADSESSIQKRTLSRGNSRIEITVVETEYDLETESEDTEEWNEEFMTESQENSLNELSDDGKLLRHTITIAVSPDHRKPTKSEILLRCGVHSVQGRRTSMEDTHECLPSLEISSQEEKMSAEADDESDNCTSNKDHFPDLSGSFEPSKEICSFFGVYDGHGGKRAADFVAQNLHQYIMESSYFHSNIRKAIKEGFKQTEEEFLELAKRDNFGDGTTAIVAFLVKNTLTVGNVGDSEGVLCRGNKAIPLTTVHNPAKNPAEIERIQKEGGRVYHSRLAHPHLNPSYFSLGVSRAIGDMLFKHPDFTKGKPSGLIAVPDIREIQLTSEDQFIILACDGLWDVMTHQEAVDLVIKSLLETDDPQTASEILVDTAYNKGSTDNITAMVCALQFEEIEIDKVLEDNRYFVKKRNKNNIKQIEINKNNNNENNEKNFNVKQLGISYDADKKILYDSGKNNKEESKEQSGETCDKDKDILYSNKNYGGDEDEDEDDSNNNIMDDDTIFEEDFIETKKLREQELETVVEDTEKRVTSQLPF